MDLFSGLAQLPDHPVWNELEKCFRVRLSQELRQEIVDTIRKVTESQPDADMNDVVLQVTEYVLGKNRG